MESAEARRRFAAAPVARLATVSADGQPHLVPVTFALLGEQICFAVDAKPKTTRQLKRLRNIAANPAVSLLVDRYADDWRRLWWSRADGRARAVSTGPEFDDALAALATKYAPYRRQLPEGPAVVVDVTTWRGWSAEG